MAVSPKKKPLRRSRANSRRGTANSKFLRARSRIQRPSGPYRPKRRPRPSRDTSVRKFWVIVLLIGLIFSMGQVWKANDVSRLCAKLDSLRRHNRELDEQAVTFRLKFKEISSYSRIEPLARETLKMRPAKEPPVIITPVDDRFLAYKRREIERAN